MSETKTVTASHFDKFADKYWPQADKLLRFVSSELNNTHSKNSKFLCSKIFTKVIIPLGKDFISKLKEIICDKLDYCRNKKALKNAINTSGIGVLISELISSLGIECAKELNLLRYILCLLIFGAFDELCDCPALISA